MSEIQAYWKNKRVKHKLQYFWQTYPSRVCHIRSPPPNVGYQSGLFVSGFCNAKQLLDVMDTRRVLNVIQPGCSISVFPCKISVISILIVSQHLLWVCQFPILNRCYTFSTNVVSSKNFITFPCCSRIARKSFFSEAKFQRFLFG